MAIRHAVLALLLTLGASWADETVVEVIAVRNRPAESLVPVLLPLAGPDGVVTASGDRLIVRATPAALAAIQRVIRDLDVAPRALLITVQQRSERTASSATAQVSGTRGGSRTVATGVFAGGTSQGSGNDTQRLRILEGTRAFIRIGRAVPLTQTQVVPSAGGAAVVQGTTYQEADTGFFVVARVSGEEVTLEISTTDDTIDDRGAMDVQRIRTTVSGRLGDWLTLGGLSRSRSERDSGVLSRGDARSAEERTVSLKVEEVR